VEGEVKPKLKPLRAVMVEWHDILDGGGEWHDDGDLAPVTVSTVGYLVSKGPKHIVVVRDYYDHDNKRVFGGKLAIPVGCIVRIVNLG
jgi:hypothetical protein